MSHATACLAKPLSPELQAEIKRHGNWFQKPKLIVLRVSSLWLKRAPFIPPTSFPQPPLNFASFFWCVDGEERAISIFHVRNERGPRCVCVCVRACVYRSGSWFGDLSSVNLPLGPGALDFHIRSFESVLHHRQGIAAHCRSLYIFPGQQCTHRVRRRADLTAANPELLSVDRCLSGCRLYRYYATATLLSLHLVYSQHSSTGRETIQSI